MTWYTTTAIRKFKVYPNIRLGDWLNRAVNIPFYMPDEPKRPVSSMVSFVDVSTVDTANKNSEVVINVALAIQPNGSINVTMTTNNLTTDSRINLIIFQDDTLE